MVGHPQNGGHRLARGEDMAGAGTQSHLPRGVQQGQQAALKGERQIPVPRAVPEWEKAAGKLPLELQLDLIAQLLHRGGGAAVQSQGPEHIPALRPPDEGVRLGGQGGAEQYRPAAPRQMALQILPWQQQAGGQTHAPLLRRQLKSPRRPPGADHAQQLPGAPLRQLSYGGLRPVGGRPHIAEDLIDLEVGQRNGQGQHTFPAFKASWPGRAARLRRSGWKRRCR